MPKLKVLLLEDSPLDAELVDVTLRDGGVEAEISVVQTRDGFTAHLTAETPDLILADYSLPQFDGISALEIAHAMLPEVPFIFVSSCIGEDTAIETMKQGATDYVLKQRMSRLVPCVTRAIREAHERKKRKHAEVVLAHNEKVAELGRLAATVAHEINNPLAAVTNLLYLIDSHSKLDDALRPYIQMARQEMVRISEITHQTLSFYRESPTRVRANLSELVQGVLWLYDRQIRNKDITITKELDPAAVAEVLPGEIRQAVSNLISNALQACPPRGKLTVKTSHARHGRTGVGGVRLTVSDNGVGIDRADRHSIYEPFYSTKGEDGTGLGLWVTRGIVEKHKGDLRFRSCTKGRNRGTTFSLFLPVQAAERSDPAEDEVRQSA